MIKMFSMKSFDKRMSNGLRLFKPSSLRPAPMRMQTQWKSMKPMDRIFYKAFLRDTDYDGTPNRYDCQPRNHFRQDSRHVYRPVINRIVREVGEIDDKGMSRGHCTEISCALQQEYARRGVPTNVVRVHTRQGETIDHSALHIPEKREIIDTQRWQYNGGYDKPIEQRKVRFSVDDYRNLGYEFDE